MAASGNNLALTLAITFNPALFGSEVFYVAARNNNGGNSDWHAVGSVTVPLSQ